MKNQILCTISFHDRQNTQCQRHEEKGEKKKMLLVKFHFLNTELSLGLLAQQDCFQFNRKVERQ